ncbi:hypothetical protein ACOB87_37230 [Streptomyces sp. YS-B37]|uniref:hypothetical protein n=1 Tax=Streptomyces sp. YS-B37 TaxID=3407669 RepID=UPI003B51286D
MQDRYRVVTGPSLSPSSVSAEELEGLADSLNALPHPVATALNDLTVNAVELAFNSLSPRHRQDLLDRLGIRIAAPRRASKSLCVDVLGRLQRESRQHTCTCGVKGLTNIVMNQVGRFVFAQDGEAVSDPVSRWGESLVRATVFAWCNASVADAYILAWAADQDWFAGTAGGDDTAQLATVGDVARSIVAVYPGFKPGIPEERELPPTAASDDGSEAAAEGTVADAATELDAVCRELDSALVRAREALDKVAALVADGCAPRDDDLAPLAALAAVFDRAEAVFHAAGIEGVSLRLEDMTRAASVHRVTHEHDLQARQTLQELLGVACHSDSPAASAAEAVRGAARRLVDAPMWEQGQREESAALVALTQLIRLGRRVDAAAEILVLQEQVVRVLPACAMAAVMAPELTLAQPEAADREPVEPSADATESTDGSMLGDRADIPRTERADRSGTGMTATGLTHEIAPAAPEPGAAAVLAVSDPLVTGDAPPGNRLQALEEPKFLRTV